MSLGELLTELNARLPEITWKVNQLQMPIRPSALPRGLFKIPLEADSTTFISEIKDDIARLAMQTNERSIRHLANTIHRKINVLVKICQMNQRKINSGEISGKKIFSLNSFSTRQQWLQGQEEKVILLSEQKQALIKTLASNTDQRVQLQLQREIGELEKQLTLANEGYQKAISR